MSQQLHIHRVEQTLLSTLMSMGSQDIVARKVIRAEHFLSEQHQYIFSAIQYLENNLIPVDIHTVYERLKKLEQTEILGGKEYLRYLEQLKETADKLETYTEMLTEKHLRKRLKLMGEQMILQAMQSGVNVRSIFRKNINAMERLLSQNDRGAMKSLSVQLSGMLQNFGRQQPVSKAYLTGNAELDALTEDIHEGTLSIIGSRSGMGKTGLLLYVLAQLVNHEKVNAAFLSMSDSAGNIAQRCKYIVHQLSHHLSEAEQLSIMNKITSSIYINDDFSPYAAQLKNQSGNFAQFVFQIKFNIHQHLVVARATSMQFFSGITDALGQ